MVQCLVLFSSQAVAGYFPVFRDEVTGTQNLAVDMESLHDLDHLIQHKIMTGLYFFTAGMNFMIENEGIHEASGSGKNRTTAA